MIDIPRELSAVERKLVEKRFNGLNIIERSESEEEPETSSRGGTVSSSNSSIGSILTMDRLQGRESHRGHSVREIKMRHTP